jgi:hypothetical protein
MTNPQSQAQAINEQTIGNQDVTNVQEREKCKQFIKAVRRNYRRELRSIQFWKVRDTFQFRARFHRRQLFAWGLSPEYAMARFMLEIHRKVYCEKYYPTAEFKAIRDSLQERVILTYTVRELP